MLQFEPLVDKLMLFSEIHQLFDDARLAAPRIGRPADWPPRGLAAPRI
jgi:hypothetical protein